MEIIDGITFTDTTISLDNRHYMNCRIDCRLRLTDAALRIRGTLILFGIIPRPQSPDGLDEDLPITIQWCLEDTDDWPNWDRRVSRNPRVQLHFLHVVRSNAQLDQITSWENRWTFRTANEIVGGNRECDRKRDRISTQQSNVIAFRMDPDDLKAKLDKDESGNIVCKPLLGWITVPAAGTAVLLALQYADTQEQAETRRGKQLRLILTPEQCLDLSDRLTILAKRLLEPSDERPNWRRLA
jgi:hypothetical protein